MSAKEIALHPSRMHNSATNVELLVMATLPPPVDGQNVVSEKVLQELRRHTTVDCFDWSGGAQKKGIGFKFRKAFRSILGWFWLVKRRTDRDQVLYTVANDGYGMIYNLVQMRVAFALGYRSVIHHHSFSYLRQRNRWMSWIVRWSGPQTIHVMLGREMTDRFKQIYGPDLQLLEIPNYYVCFNAESSQTNLADDDSVAFGRAKCRSFGFNESRPLRIGHMSNLSLEKGVGRAIEVFEELIERKQPVELHVAGPATQSTVEQILDDCVNRHGSRVNIYGPVHGHDKDEFFRNIDVFLFPTLYRSEAQPLVIIEAFDGGCPVITYDIGCIRSLVSVKGGFVFSSDSNFRKLCADQIVEWIRYPDHFEIAVKNAELRRDEIQSEAKTALSTLVSACLAR